MSLQLLNALFSLGYCARQNLNFARTQRRFHAISLRLKRETETGDSNPVRGRPIWADLCRSANFRLIRFFSTWFDILRVSVLSVFVGVKVIDDCSATAVLTHADEESVV